MTLADLFAGRSQLVIYHFMFGPDWQEGCPSCSFVSDHIDGARPHLAARDVTVTMVSRAPLAKIEAFKKRMRLAVQVGVVLTAATSTRTSTCRSPRTRWRRARWTTTIRCRSSPARRRRASASSTRTPHGDVFHTYSTYGRGLDPLVGAYTILDLVPKGRDEDHLGFSMEWVRHHDRYGTNEFADADKPYWPETASPASATCGCGSTEVHV